MGGFIKLEDGRAWAAANWAYDAVLDCLVEALKGERASDLAAWLAQQTCAVRGMGLGHVDLRELAPTNRALFRVAARKAVEHAQDGVDGHVDAEVHAEW